MLEDLLGELFRLQLELQPGLYHPESRVSCFIEGTPYSRTSFAAMIEESRSVWKVMVVQEIEMRVSCNSLFNALPS